MKKLIIMRGPQGVGKSTFLRDLGLETHTLATDTLRLTLASPVLGPDGSWGISQEQNDRAWGMFNDLCKQRMGRGETLALDAMFRGKKDLEAPLAMAQEFGYQALVVDFSSFPADRALTQNLSRSAHRQVSQAVLEKTVAAFAATPAWTPDARYTRILWESQGGTPALLAQAQQWLRAPTLDFSNYERVMHIGDLQGCLTVLAGAGAPLEKGFRDDTRYIFVGDLLDRGIENGALLKWLIPQALARDNIDLIWGNHEDHLWRFAQGLEAHSREFRDRTQPQLIEAGIAPADAKALLAKARPLLPYSWRGQKVIVTHAGLPGLPPMEAGEPQWHLLSLNQLSRGSGNYSDPIDQQWQQSMQRSGETWIQVHGHRNNGAQALRATPSSFNLEDQVEFGGNLRIATLTSQGWEEISRTNTVFNTWRKRFERAPGAIAGAEMADAEQAPDITLPVPAWIKQAQPAGTQLPKEVIDAMRAHSGVLEKPMPSSPHISSLNFTRDVFFDKKWDDVVVKARGLFFNTESGEIVARGYDKFFNVGERPETQIEALRANLKFPIVAYVKENGYLGNLGYDAKNDALFIASKSTSAGDFASWFKEIFEASVPARAQERIKRYLRDAEASMVFEVIDADRDPHMIDYDTPKLVLLDVFQRGSETRKLGYEALKTVGEKLGLGVKRRGMEFHSASAFEGWMNSATKDLAHRHSGGEDVEGYVIEDQAGFQTKIKLPHYAFWKRMRSSKDRIGRISDTMKAIEARPNGIERNAQAYEKAQSDLARALNSDEHPLARSFLGWCAQLPREDLDLSVLKLRKRYDQEVGIDPALLKIRWANFDPSEKEQPKKKIDPQAPQAPARAPKMR